jgi:serine carboxypeptidase-like clade I
MPRQRTLTSEAAGGRLLLVVVAVLLCLSVPLGRAAPPGAEVAEFPGFTGKLPSKHYAGYDLSSSIYEKKSNILCRVQYLRLHCIHTISSVLQTFRVRRYVTVGQHEQRKRHLYYYLAVSERNPSLDPVVIWINGGPACSGFSAFLHSFGKYVLSCDGICSVFWPDLVIEKKCYMLFSCSLCANDLFLQDLFEWRAPKFISTTVHE